VGSGSHVAAEYFFRELAKVPATHVPFQGGAPAITATLGGQIDALATTLGGGAAAQVKSGKLKGLAIAGSKRAAVVPDVPTYDEQGFKGFTAASWVGVFAPSKTDPEIVAALNKAIVDTIKSETVQQRLTSIGFDPLTLSQAESDSMFKSELAKWGHMVKTLGLSVE
jgi:tripartite-type tricarboxylate transporter receptor subunit TctC